MLYFILIVLSASTIAVVNIFAGGLSFAFWQIILIAAGNTVAVIAVDGLFAFIIRRLPKKWFSPDKKIFNVGKRERAFYNAIRLPIWKDKIPEWGKFTDFHKDKVYNPNDNTYVGRFLLESNYGYIIHIVGVFVGFLIIFFMPLKYCLNFGVPVAAVNAVLNLPPAFILRYNTPRLKALYAHNARKAAANNPAPESKNDLEK